MATLKTSATEMFRKKVQSAMAKIQDYKKFEDSDSMVKLIMDTGRTLFEGDLDKKFPPELVRLGGKLAGVYGYLGQKSAYARAERDVYEQKLSEVEKDLMLAYLDDKYKVTEARAKVSAEVENVRELVIEKDAIKNQWESIVDATSTMLMFLQSAIKVKENERYQSKNIQDNG